MSCCTGIEKVGVGNFLRSKGAHLQWRVMVKVKVSQHNNQNTKYRCVAACTHFRSWCGRLKFTGNKKSILGIFFSWWIFFPVKGFTAIKEPDCSVEISAGDGMQFSNTEIVVKKSCTIVTVTLRHVGKLPLAGMGHNWVLTRESDFRGVVSDGIDAGASNNFIREGDSRVLAATRMIGGGESTAVSFSTESIKVGEKYTFFCSYPGHWGIMKGTFLLT